MKYTLIIRVETSRKMQGSDEFLLCTAQRAGLKRKLAKAKVLEQAVVPGHARVVESVRSRAAAKSGKAQPTRRCTVARRAGP